jgi:predicted aspartyl protease
MTLYTANYDETYDPAMPVIEVTIAGPAGNVTLTSIVDSGADGTIIPLRALEQIGVAPSGWTRVSGLDGVSRRIRVYRVILSIGPLSVGRVRVGGDKTTRQMILGRDVLNFFIVTLNGLANVVEISD